MNHFYFNSKQLLKILDDNKELLDLIFSINNLRNNYIINPQDIINAGSDSSRQAQTLLNLQHSIINQNSTILEVVRSQRPNKIYELVNSFITNLNLFDPSYNDDNKLIKELKEFPEKHTDAYSEKQASQIFAIIESSHKIVQSINDLKDKSVYIVQEFDKQSKNSPSNYSELRIGTDQDIPLIEDFIIIFKSLEGLYNFICYLNKIDSDKNHIILNQVSTGSWYTELLGIKQVVISIENLLKGIGSFIRDLITGKISREKFENECKKAEAFIHLLSVAKTNGINNAELGIFKELNPLINNFIKDTTIIEINDEEILKLRKTEKLTLLERRSERAKLLEKINLSIESGDKKTKK